MDNIKTKIDKTIIYFLEILSFYREKVNAIFHFFINSKKSKKNGTITSIFIFRSVLSWLKA